MGGLVEGKKTATLAAVIAVLGGLLGASPAAAAETIPEQGGGTAESVMTSAEPGTLTITVALGNVDLGDAVVDPTNELLTTSAAELKPITVTDTRAGNPGYNVTGRTGDFTSPADHRINGANLGWRPRILSQEVVQALVAGVSVSPSDNPLPPGIHSPDGLATARSLASAPAGGGIGTAVITAALLLHAPSESDGDQTTLTITII